jgi:recombination protein RecA
VKKSGSWFSYEDTKLGQGVEKSKDFLRENPEILAEIEAKVKDQVDPDALARMDDATDDTED